MGRMGQNVKNTVPTEEQEQIALFEWAELQSATYPELKLMFHIPNEGRRSYAAGKAMKRAGLRSGVPDIFLPAAHGGAHGLFIEMKRQRGSKISPQQKSFLTELANAGYAAEIAFGWVQAAEIIKEYLSK